MNLENFDTPHIKGYIEWISRLFAHALFICFNDFVYSGGISGVLRTSVWEIASRYRELVGATSHPWKRGFSATFKFH